MSTADRLLPPPCEEELSVVASERRRVEHSATVVVHSQFSRFAARAAARLMLEDGSGVRTVVVRHVAGEEDVHVLALATKHSTAMTSLVLCDLHTMDVDGVAAFARALEGHASLMSLKLMEVVHGGRGLVEAALVPASRLEMLDVGGTAIHDEGARAVAAALSAGSPPLTYLRLTEGDLGEAGALAIGDALAGNRTLTELALESNDLGGEGVAAIAAALEAGCAVRRLVLRECMRSRGGETGSRAIGRALGSNATLESLDLSLNETIGDAGAAAIALGLEANTTLTKLNLSVCRIAAAGTRALGNALRRNAALVWLDLDGNETDAGVADLAGGLAANRTLRVLTLFNAGVDLDGARALFRALERNAALERLDLAQNRDMGEDFGPALADALRANRSLTWLDLARGGLAPEGQRAVAAALDVNFTLVRLDVDESSEFAGVAVNRNRALWTLARDQRAELERAPDENVPWLIPDLVRIVAGYAGPAADAAEPWLQRRY